LECDGVAGKKKRYWGLAIFSFFWVFVQTIIASAAGTTMASAVTLLWLFVGVYAVTGNITAILTTYIHPTNAGITSRLPDMLQVKAASSKHHCLC